MKQRIISAAVAIVIFVAAVVTSIMFEPLILYFGLAFVAVVGEYEALNAIGSIKTGMLSIPSFLFTLVVVLSAYFGNSSLEIIICAALLYVLVLFLYSLTAIDTVSVEQLSMTLMVTCMVSLPMYAITRLYWSSGILYGMTMLFYCLMCAWLTDTGAYFTGTLIGKHKLAPRVSPKKTVEGAIGGLFTALALIWVAAWLLTKVTGVLPYTVNVRNLIIMTCLCSVVSMIGDLSFSLIKRRYDVKDYGNIMPGHGGVLDRFDSVMFVCPVVCVLNSFIPIFQ